MKQMIQGYELAWRVNAGAGATTHLVQPAHDFLIEILMVPHGVIDAVAVFHQPRQNVIDVGDGKRIIGAIRVTRPFQTGPAAMPGFRVRIAFTAKQHVLGLPPPRNQHRHRLRFGEPGEIEKIAVGAIGIIHIAVTGLLGRCLYNRNGAAAHHLQDTVATAGKLFDIGGVHCADHISVM